MLRTRDGDGTRLAKLAQAPADKFINGAWMDDCVVLWGVWVGI